MKRRNGLRTATDGIRQIAAEAHMAAERIAGMVRETPLQRSAYLSRRYDADVYVKLENRQVTGSFKLRGAANCLLGLSASQKLRGCVAASSGNHGAAVAYAMRELGVTGVVFVPERTSAVKVDAIRDFGGDVRFFGRDGLDTEGHAREYADKHGLYYVSPYNDPAVIAGQGTCGVEIERQKPGFQALFVAVGGGGLLSGVGSVLRMANPDLDIVACQPEASAVMARSVAAGRILDLPSDPTLSDGTAGGVEPGSITFPICGELTDAFVTVSEASIAAAMREFAAEEDTVIEGAAAVAVAALGERAKAIRGRRVVVVICGGNVSADVVDEVIRADAAGGDC